MDYAELYRKFSLMMCFLGRFALCFSYFQKRADDKKGQGHFVYSLVCSNFAD